MKLGACALASMNRTGKTNAKKGPKVDFNAYKDFHDREIEAHIIASFMEFAGMKSVQGDDACILSSNYYLSSTICVERVWNIKKPYCVLQFCLFKLVPWT